MRFIEIRRLCHIICTFRCYGLDELIPKTPPFKFLRVLSLSFFWIRCQHQDKLLSERLRLALQSLGPVWIKLGQMLSTRPDLLPEGMIAHLALLQDAVLPFDGGVAKRCIEQALGFPIEEVFEHFDICPLASASVAQVHSARLKQNQQEVVIKVIRPGIEAMIQDDIHFMYFLARWLPRLYVDGHRLRPVEAVREFEKNLFSELNLLDEAANAIRLQRNFVNSSLLYIPEIYSDYCRDELLVMERIYGVAVSDIATLQAHGVNMKLLAERGVDIFFTQVFCNGFFHADMHPGNIFVDISNPQNPRYIAVDFGIVGTLNEEDKRYLAENFIAFFNRDYRKVAKLHIDSGWVPQNTSLDDFERAIHRLCEPIFKKPLAEISFGQLLFNLFKIARRFKMQVQPQLLLLQKTLLYIEGLGRQLYPALDLWTTAKPYLEECIRTQVSLTGLFTSFKNKAPYWLEKLPELPELFYNSLQQQQRLLLQVEKLNHQVYQQSILHARMRYSLTIGTLLFIAANLLFFLGGFIKCGLALIILSAIVWWRGWCYKNKVDYLQ